MYLDTRHIVGSRWVKPCCRCGEWDASKSGNAGLVTDRAYPSKFSPTHKDGFCAQVDGRGVTRQRAW